VYLSKVAFIMLLKNFIIIAVLFVLFYCNRDFYGFYYIPKLNTLSLGYIFWGDFETGLNFHISEGFKFLLNGR
jgi:hypothetical protein